MIEYGIKFKHEFINDGENALAICFFSKNESEYTSIELYIDDWADMQLLINFVDSFKPPCKEYLRKDFNDKINPEIFHDIKKIKAFL